MRRTQGKASERGFAFVIVGAWLVLLLFVGMAVDYGIVLRWRRAMQNACDAGVLAGAMSLHQDSTGAAAKSATSAYAVNDMTQNNVSAGTPVVNTLDASGNQTGTNPVAVQATLAATVPTFFYRGLTPSVGVGVNCTAQEFPVIQTSGAVPVAIDANTFESAFGNQPCTANDTRTVCQSDYPLITGQNSCGPGCAGLLNLSAPGCGNGNGASGWGCIFRNGASNSICATSTPNSPPACAQVQTTSGNGKNGGLDDGIWGTGETPPGRCAAGAAPGATVVIVPLVSNLATCSSTCVVVGFAGFQLDCAAMPAHFTGNSFRIPGKFIFDFADNNAVTSTTCSPSSSCDFGVETIRLILSRNCASGQACN